MTEETVLQEAERIINGQRRKDYGGPLESFTRIAELWSAYLNNCPNLNTESATVELDHDDVAMLMILLKVARYSAGGKDRDSLVDIAGYAGCMDLIQTNRTRAMLAQDFPEEQE